MQTKQVAAKQQGVHARNVANNAIVRMVQRIAAVQALRASKNAARKQVANQQAFMLQMQQLAAQYGVNPAQLLQVGNARANSATHKPSAPVVHTATGAHNPCKAVHELCATMPGATRAQMVQACTDAGINPNTAKTQVGVYRAKAKAAQQAAQ
jgi:hypothetical protein